MGNLAFICHHNQLIINNIHKNVNMQVVRKIHSDVTTVFRTTPKQSKEASPKERL